MHEIKFEIGDVILHTFYNVHSVMWVGGEKEVVHNTNSGKFNGVLRQGSAYFSKFLDDFKKKPVQMRIFRGKFDDSIKKSAAEYAIKWSMTGEEFFGIKERNEIGAKIAETVPEMRHKPQPEKWKSPYSIPRFTVAQRTNERSNDPVKTWTVDTLFRAVKAIARHQDDSGLSPNHGTSCSQFVVYCYQAASLEHSVGSVVAKELVNHLRNPETGGFYKLKGDRNIIADALTPTLNPKNTVLNVDAKIMTVSSLKEVLEKSDQFTQVGYVACDAKACKGFALDGEVATKLKYEEVNKELGLEV